MELKKLKIEISYFYQIRNFTKNRIPISTAKWDPKWYHDFTYDYNYVFKDKRGVYNGIRTDAFLLPDNYECICPCDEKKPWECSFLKDYLEHLRSLDFQDIYDNLERIAKKVALAEAADENFGEPIIVLMVYETPTNQCSERGALKAWFAENGIEVNEYSS